MRTCSRCGLDKPPDDFKPKSGMCAPCRTDYGREYRKANAARLRKNRQAWYAKNREDNLAYQAEWREKNPDKKRKSDTAWREANRESHLGQQRLYRAATREKRSAYFRALAQVRKHDPRYREIMAGAKARRRARVAQVEHQPYTRIAIFERDNGTCRGCNVPLTFAKGTFHIDHIVPIALGGPDIPANLQLMCPPCNHRKSDTLAGQIHLPV